MIEWKHYKDHKIKACSQKLIDTRWMPVGIAWLSTGGKEHIKVVPGELIEIRPTEEEADRIAIKKVQQWVDQRS